MCDNEEPAQSGVPPTLRRPAWDRWYVRPATGLVAVTAVVTLGARWCTPAAARSAPGFLPVQILKWGAFMLLLQWHLGCRDPHARAPHSTEGELRSFGMWMVGFCLVVPAITAIWIVLALLFPAAYW